MITGSERGIRGCAVASATYWCRKGERWEVARPVAVLVALEGFERLGPLGEAEVGEGVLGRPVVGDLPAGCEDEQAVADVEAQDAVGDDDDRAAVVGEAAQHVHHRAVHAGVEAGGRFVQEEQGGLGEQFQGDADPLALSAGEAVHGLPGALLQTEFADDLVDAFAALGLRGVLREAQFGGVGQGAADGQLGVQDVVLRDQADALAQFGVVAVEVAAVVEDGAVVGGALAGEGIEEGGLAGAARAHDGEQALLPHREGHVVQQRLAAVVDGDREVLDVEGDLAGVDVLLERVADQAERRVADAEDVTGSQGGAGDGPAVEVGAVVAAQVDDLVRAVGPGAQLGVAAGDDQVVDDEVVVLGTADTDGAGGQRTHGGGLAEGAGQAGHRDGGGALRGGEAQHDRAGAVGRAAEADHAAGADVPLVDAAAVGVGAVGAVLVLEGPMAGLGSQHRVVPRDPGIVDDDVAQRVASDVVVVARAHHRGAGVGLQDELGRRRCDRPLRHA
ncbi:hypothetical protein M2155_008740 [Streptomyces sp. SAI-119]|nr:hypothetical protein [Streptomyces sp. SAI-119]